MTMIGRRVSHHYTSARHGDGEAIKWEPLGAGMTDTLVRFDSGYECWFAGRELQPVDGLGPLPSRDDARRAADEKALRDLATIRAGVVGEIRNGVRWPGAEHGKALLGRAVDGALADTRKRLRRACCGEEHDGRDEHACPNRPDMPDDDGWGDASGCVEGDV